MPKRMAGVTRLYILCILSPKAINRSCGSIVLIFPLHAGHRSEFVLSRSCSAIHVNMQSSCASRVQGHALTQTVFGVSAGLWRQIKQERVASVWARSKEGLGVEGALTSEVVARGPRPAAGASFDSEDMLSRADVGWVFPGRRGEYDDLNAPKTLPVQRLVSWLLVVITPCWEWVVHSESHATEAVPCARVIRGFTALQRNRNFAVTE